MRGGASGGRATKGCAAPAAVLCACLALGVPALGQQTSTVTAAATIAGSVRITNTGPLNFGDVFPSPAPGTVTVGLTTAPTPVVTRTAAGGAFLVGTAFSAATFLVERTGTGNPHIYVTLPAGAVTITRSGGGASMTVDTFRSNLNASCDGSSPGPCPAAPFPLWVGARLGVSANQAPGVYTGTFGVTAHQF